VRCAGGYTRKPEIHDLHALIGQDHDISGFYVPMHYAVLVREMEAFGDLLHDVELIQQRKRPAAADYVLQVLALEKLHDHVGRAVMLAEIVDSDDVLVVKVAGSGGFVSETGQQVLVVAVDSEDFNRYLTVHGRIPGAIDVGETALANFSLDLISTDILNHPR
jgi:hypothetical protein